MARETKTPKTLPWNCPAAHLLRYPNLRLLALLQKCEGMELAPANDDGVPHVEITD